MSTQQGDCYICIYIPFHILFHFGLSWDIEYSSLCYTVGPCCLSILYMYVCVCVYIYINLYLLIPNSLLVATSLFSVSEKLFLVCGYVHLCQILDFTRQYYPFFF